MIIHRKILVKVIVTESFKEKVLAEMQEGLKKMEAEISFLEQRAKKTITELTIKASPQAQAVREQMEWEKKKREDAKTELIERVKMVTALKEGTEITQGEVEGPFEVKVGDNWSQVFKKEIILKDGVVVDIR